MQLSPGTHVGPYEIVALIGAGGMGEVYRATDPRIRRDVAVKVIRGAAATTDTAARRFELEAQAAGQLNHPNIVTVFDVGTYEGSPYLVTELLQGETLRAKIHHGPIPPRRAVEYAAQIANGLAAAHDRGFVHRDLKPNNLFVTSDDSVKILDFGLVKLTEPAAMSMAADDQTTHTAPPSETVVGTHGYMSPEQIRGEPVDHRSDIFSLGIVLCEMLSGHHPFRRSSSVETLSATIAEEPRVEMPERVPPGLDAIVARCLEKKPANRFQSAHDLAFSLREIATHEPSSSGISTRRPLPRFGSGAAAPQKGPTKRAVLFAIAAIAVAALGAGAFLAGRFTARPALPSYQQLTFRRGLVQSARFTPDGHTIVYGAAWQGKPLELYSVRPESPESRPLDLPSGDILSISSAGEMAISIGRRHVVGFNTRGTLARVGLGGGAPREVLTDVDDADWSPDGETLAVAHVVNGKYRLEYPIGEVLYETDGWISHLRVSPDGSRVAFMDHPSEGDDLGTVFVVGRDRQAKALTHSWVSANGLAWSPRGREVWFTASEAGPNCRLYAVDLSGRMRLVAQSLGRLVLQDVHPSGKVLMTAAQFRIALAYRHKPAEPDRDMSWLDVSIANDLSSDGKTVLFAEQGAGAGTAGALYSRTIDQSAAIRLGDGSLGAFSPDGSTVAGLVLGGRPTLTLLPTGAGSAVRLAAGSIADFVSVAWFPDGRHVLVSGVEAGHDVRLYSLPVSGGPPRTISAEGIHTITYSKPVSPDGSRIAGLDRSGNIVLQPADGGAASRVSGASAGETPIRWNASGTGLYVYRKNELPARVYMLDLARGQKELVAIIGPSDPAGVYGITALLLAPEGDNYLYSYTQTLSSLYLAAGLR